MEEMVERGLVKSTGVSNFLPRHLEGLLQVCKIRPAVNQIKIHPLSYDAETIEYCRRNGIILEAYTPLSKGDASLMQHPRLLELSRKYSRTVSQIILRWGVQQAVSYTHLTLPTIYSV
eukprot:TRINITY_DN14860_c0_g1_i1.p1 TRINITY_DN14860_c0_g1~~TRINITY_DN14860_c0_g1_i1.p1  ORF type:complete len:118 (+),score=22.91 TRINITY_DN14860_c0_g1_i1:253-606(+)